MGTRLQKRMAPRARVWLPEQLAAGPRPATDLYKAALEIGISNGILSYVMRKLDIKTTRRRDGWYWEMP